MKKILILIVGISLYFHFYPNSEGVQWYENQKEAFLTMLSKSMKVTSKTNLSGLYDELEKKFNSFSEIELQNLKVITNTSDDLTRFYEDNCVGGKTTKLFHPDNADKVCRKIASYVSKN